MSCGASAPRCTPASRRRPSRFAWRLATAPSMPARRPSKCRALGGASRDIRILELQKFVRTRDENCHGPCDVPDNAFERECAPESESTMRQDFYLTDEQRAMRDLVRSVSRDRIAPLAARVGEAEGHHRQALQAPGQ